MIYYVKSCKVYEYPKLKRYRVFVDLTKNNNKFIKEDKFIESPDGFTFVGSLQSPSYLQLGAFSSISQCDTFCEALNNAPQTFKKVVNDKAKLSQIINSEIISLNSYDEYLERIKYYKLKNGMVITTSLYYDEDNKLFLISIPDKKFILKESRNKEEIINDKN